MDYMLQVTCLLTVMRVRPCQSSPGFDFFEEGIQLAPGASHESLAQVSPNCRCQHLPSSACCRHPVLRSQCQQFCSSDQCPSSAGDQPQCPYCSGRLQARSVPRCPYCLRQLQSPLQPRCPFCARRLQARAASRCPHCARQLRTSRQVSLCPCCACLCPSPPDSSESASTSIRPERSLHESPAAEELSLPNPSTRSLSQLVSPRLHPFPGLLRRRKRAIITQNGLALLMETHLGPGAVAARGKRHLFGPAGLASLSSDVDDDPCQKVFSCRNGGTCVRKPYGEVRCRCLEGWTGRFCTHRQ